MTPENFDNKDGADKVVTGANQKPARLTKSFDLARKMAGPVILATSALSANADAQSTQDILRQAEQLEQQAQRELKRASVLHMQQGVLLVTIGNLEEAKKMFNKALELDPANKEAQAYLDVIKKGSL